MLNDTIIRRIGKVIKENHYRRLWRKNNKHNKTILRQCSKPSLISVGNNTYGEINLITFGNEHKLVIRNYVSIAPGVYFVLDAEHYTNHISTYPFKVGILGEKVEAFGKGDIIIDDDVWIGYGSTILSGIHIGQGAVVASGAVVTHDVPPYAIVGGVPAKVIKYRFSQPVINYMTTLDFGALTEHQIQSYVNDLYKPIKNMSLEEVKKIFSWFPKKQDL